MSLRRAEAIVHPRDSCDLDGRLSGSLASFKFAIGVRFKKDRSDSFRKDLAPRPILLFQKNEGMAKGEDSSGLAAGRSTGLAGGRWRILWTSATRIRRFAI